MNEKDYLGIIETAKPLLDQIHLSICLCNKEGTIVYVNPHAAQSIKAMGNLLDYQDIETGFEVVGTNMDKWHHLKGFTDAMEERNGKWGTWHLKGARWRPRSDCVRADNGEVIGYIGAWEQLDHGPVPKDKTEATFETPEYVKEI